MGVRIDAVKRLITGRPRQSDNGMTAFTTHSMAQPPDRNTVEWLKAYITNPRLAPVRKIATDLAAVSGKLYRCRGDQREEVETHPFLDFWGHLNPLPELTPAAIWKLLEIWYQLKGEALCVIERDHNGMPAELWPVPPHWVAEIPHRGQPYYILQNTEGQRVPVPVRDMFALRDLNPVEPYGRGMGQAESVADEVEAYEYATKFSKTVFFNNARADYFICAPGITEEQATRFLAKLDKRHRGPWNAHRPGIIPKEVTIHRLSDSPREMDFVASRKDLRDTVNSHWAVPPELLGIVENSNRATAEAAKAIYAENVLMPQLLIRQAAINGQLLPQFDPNLTWEYDDIIPQDEQYQLQVANEGIARCTIMINEWREKMGFDPLPNGNAFVVPMNAIIVPADELLTFNALLDDEKTPNLTQETFSLTPNITLPADTTERLEPEAQAAQIAKETSLNGAQIASLVDIVQAVNIGELSRESAIEIIISAFPFNKEKAAAILGQSPNPKRQASMGALAKKARKRAPNRALVRRTMDATRKAQERMAKQIVLRCLHQQHKAILAALGTERKAGNDGWERLLRVELGEDLRIAVDRVEDILRQCADWDGAERILQRTLSPIWQSAYNAGSQLALDTYGLTGIQQPNMARHLLEQGAARVKGISETTRKELAKAIAQGMMEGDGRQQLIKRVQDTMPGVSPGRASVIASCEVHTSLMSGNFDMLKAAGYTTKTWLTAGDNDVRASHRRLHGITVGINERFPNGLLYPGDPHGSPGEIIGCRCDLIAGEEPQSRPVQPQDRDGILRADNDDNDYDQGGLLPATPEKITEIASVTPQSAREVLDRYEPEIAGQNYETAIIVTSGGQAYRIKGHINGVNIHGLSDADLYGIYMSHNHPDNVTHHSFSAYDLSEAIKYRFAELRGFDSEYEYILRILPDTIRKEDYMVQHEFTDKYLKDAAQLAMKGKLDMDVDDYHYVCQKMSEDYGFYYERKRKK